MYSKKIASIDAESVGLYGRPFSIAVVCYNNGIETKKFTIRRELASAEKEFAQTQIFKDDAGNVTFSLPACIQQSNSIQNVAPSYEAMLKEFAAFWLEVKKEYTAMFHMGFVVESFLFRECVRLGFLGQFDGPYLPIELSEVLRSSGYYKPDSVDTYAKENGLEINCDEKSHHPEYDCRVAAAVYFSI